MDRSCVIETTLPKNFKSTAIIIQARMGSQRFPGKMTVALNGIPLIRWVLHRVKRSRLADAIVLATAETPDNLPLVREADDCGISVYQGSEYNVLGRFLGAAQSVDAQTVVRVCADNPFVSPEEIDRLIEFFQTRDLDYAYNHVPTPYYRAPDGLGAEITSYSILQRVDALTSDQRDREHVTIYIREHPELFRLSPTPSIPELIEHEHERLDIDTLGALKELQGRFPALTPDVSLASLLDALRSSPGKAPEASLNQH